MADLGRVSGSREPSQERGPKASPKLMQGTPMSADDLVARLNQRWEHPHPRPMGSLVNPDGPEAAQVISTLTEALREISEGCGMLNQPAALNGPEEAWLRRRIETYERTAVAVLSKVAGMDK